MSRAGTSVPEALLGLLLGALMLQLAWTFLSTQAGVIRRLVRGAEAAESARVIRGVLRAELRAGRPGADWRALDDSVVLRSFRGTGLACGFRDDGAVPVTYRGWLRPRPGVDSVLVLDADGRWSGALLAGASRAEDVCPGDRGGGEEVWELDPAPKRGPVLLRLFRAGSYHLSGTTFRYRRGLGGRQPLTPPLLDARDSGLSPGPDGSVRLRIRFRTLPATPGLNPGTSSLWPDGG